jgi:hypothetical protein
MGVMPADDSCTGVFRPLVGGKHVWPQPKAAGTGVLSFQRKRYIDRANPLRDILRMAALDVRDMFLERYDQVFRQHRHPILHAVAIARDALLWREIEVTKASQVDGYQPLPQMIGRRFARSLGPERERSMLKP